MSPRDGLRPAPAEAERAPLRAPPGVPEDLPEAAAPATLPSRRRLAVEFGVLFVGLPLALAFGLPPSIMWTLLACSFALGLALLAITPGFRFAEFLEGSPSPGIWPAPVFAVATGAAIWTLTLWLIPQAMFWMPIAMPDLWLMILLLYPILSALPQEALFRVLFFRRYGALFPSKAAAVTTNAAVFALAHLFLWNGVALILTAAGGAIFALAYLHGRGRNFWFPVLLHAIAGWLIFTIGLGRFFYHGAVPT
ncbi:CPBP family intramembrane metalloprotease [Albimonas sp. CAU 1670]|uniref:CPBP family intramembrane glutamic endopeptidase n=1 Tax=Albimonas sp. CAU 1670 TaxID=3032599 RepID=UPI0023DCD328|nr:CPBP family intramembrane glutamic endopeptidase [Albimonas sp. CAU 1670]MDF2233121.1 CPBP family intramembrane metalloprotease [Albimonas sp. CAU 1670]